MRCDDELLGALYASAREIGYQRGLTRHDAEDCAAAFIEKLLARQDGAEHDPDHLSAAWLTVCKHNHVTDFSRALARRRSRVLSTDDPALKAVTIGAQTASLADSEPMCRLLRAEFWRMVETAMARLRPAQQELLRKHYLEGESAREIAQSTGRSVTSIEQSLFRARSRLRHELLRSGVEVSELKEYAGLLASGPPPAPAARRPVLTLHRRHPILPPRIP